MLFSLTFLSAGLAYGQAQQPSKSIQGPQNPFDYTLGLIAAPGAAKARQSQQSQTFAKGTSPLQYRGSLSGGQAQAKTLIENLTLKYGPPTSIRGQSHVWDVENPNAGGAQAKIVTIIVKSGTSGEAALIMDRDRGEDGRATYTAPRIAKAAPPKTPTQKPIIDPRLVNND